MSSFFAHPFYNANGGSTDPSFTPLFRLLDDFDSYSREVGPNTSGQAQTQGRRQRRQHLPMFSPKFDLRETETNFELHGELPGIDKDHINIDFIDPQTIVIKGKVDRSYTAGTPPAGWIAGSRTAGNIAAAEGSGQRRLEHQASVEAVPEEGEASTSSVATTTPPTTAAGDEAGPSDGARYWISERSTGQFQRSFGFPCPVNQDGVIASLKEGILHVTVPKATRQASRRITVQ